MTIKTLVLGASGATGKLLVEQLLELDQAVRVIVRSAAVLPETWLAEPKLSIVRANISDIEVAEMQGYINDCDAIVSCLGHNLSFKGIYGSPRKLVTDAIALVCNAIEGSPGLKPKKLILMSTSGYHHPGIDKPRKLKEKLVIGLIGLLVPPHRDNMAAADFLRIKVGANHPTIEWIAVRPDSLVNSEQVSEYQVLESHTRSPIFDPGETSRINVANFMARSLMEKRLWEHWNGKMPLVYNVS